VIAAVACFLKRCKDRKEDSIPQLLDEGFTPFVIFGPYRDLQMKINRDFYLQDDVVGIARNLLGKVIFTHFGSGVTSGIITETEAYAGVIDRASHAYGNRRTARTETMFREGGVAYIYLCYGVHHLFNFVTNGGGVPHAVLLRAIYPLDGIQIMERRTGKLFKGRKFTDGPGKLTKALGITTSLDGTDLTGSRIWVEDIGARVGEEQVISGPRIGVDYAGPDARLPYRFLLNDLPQIKKPPLL
jgi:DNA-3-methyladenine glycosylase